MLLAFQKRLSESPYSILLMAFILTGLGLLTLYSISSIGGGAGVNAFSKQVIFLGLAFLLFLFMWLIPKHTIHKYIYILYGITLIAVLLPFLGEKVAGTHRWIQFGLPVGFQPSEMAKWVTILALARYLSDHNLQMGAFKSILIPFLIGLIPTIIILRQPDLGTALILTTPIIPMCYWAGARPYFLFLILAPIFSVLTAFHVVSFTGWAILMGVIIFLSRPKLWHGITLYFGNIFLGLLAPLIWNSLKPYQQKRVLTFFNPELDPLGAAYQIIQSKTALGSGGLWGKGWGQGTQTHLKFLPVQESDFILSVIGEELGFIVILAMLTVFLIFTLKIVKLAFISKDRFSGLALLGMAIVFIAHVFVNSAMTAGLIPVKGLPLPFISYGGSFLLTCFMMVGLIMNLGTDDRG